MKTATPQKKALVTGGSGGIGSAICRQLANDGFHVIVHANRSLEVAQSLVAEITAAGGSAQALAFDVTDAAATSAALEALLEEGPVQVLVNNAGIHNDAIFPGMQLTQWQQVIDVSLNGFFHVTQPLMMPMIRTRWGRIITITSVAAVAGELLGGQRRAAFGHKVAGTRSGQPRHHRQRRRARHHHHSHEPGQL
jgi:3-oxoacyl-[acyl-carrier protein] reductase